MSRGEYTFLPYLIFAQRTTTKKEANDMKTLSEIVEEFENATPERQNEITEALSKIPEVITCAGMYFFKSLSPANFEILKRMRGGFV